jgi:hypothetical protein
MQHLEYDLIITNVFTAPVTLTSVEAIAPDGSPLLQLAGDALAANTEPVFCCGVVGTTGPAPSSQIPVGGVVATVIDLVVPPGEVPERISHRIAYDLPPDAPALSLIADRAISGPVLAVDPRAPLVIAPPLRGTGWLAISGCCDAFSAHRSLRVVVDGARYVKVETFAIDWVQLQSGLPFAGDGSQNEQYSGFGADVISAADGTVVSVRDDMPEQTPNQPPVGIQQEGDYGGNHVIVQMLPDVWAVYAHLQPGSVAVQVGDRVTTGQRLGRLGNSGNSFVPHLHFQLSDGPDPLTSNSLPFVFDRYTLVGKATAAPAGEDALEPMAAAPAAPVQVPIEGTPNAQTSTYPLTDTVQDFPPAPAGADRGIAQIT